MTKEEKKEQMIKKAGDYYNVGLNCPECVLQSWLDMDESGYPPEIIALASPLRCGFGQNQKYVRCPCRSLPFGCDPKGP